MHKTKFFVLILHIMSIFFNFAHQNEEDKDCIRMF